MRDSREGTHVGQSQPATVHPLSGEIVCPPEKAVCKASTEDRERQRSAQGGRGKAQRISWQGIPSNGRGRPP